MTTALDQTIEFTCPCFYNHFFFSLFTLQHSLVSEIRDIVYPEDRLRFDELMFRHGVTVNVLSNNVATLYGRSGVCLILPLFNCSLPSLNRQKDYFRYILNSLYVHREFLKIGLEVEAAMLN